MDENVERDNHSIDWIGLIVKVVIFAILLVLLIWIVSKFSDPTSNKKCNPNTIDYYSVTSFTEDDVNNSDGDKYTYVYTVMLDGIDTNNIEEVSLKSYNYFHSDDEYKQYIEINNENISVVNQDNNDILVDDYKKLKKASLTPSNFSFNLSDVYMYEGDFYLDIKVVVSEYSKVKSYNGNYFVPIHIVLDAPNKLCK